ncbi:MAG TPA: hypothetical protein VLD57_03320 [Blastocatellia bacterium]|nr:hypothetical protein [Blastocatellia bacterium]
MTGSAILYLALFFQQSQGHPEMTAGGWVFMIISWAGILWLTIYTFARILRRR